MYPCGSRSGFDVYKPMRTFLYPEQIGTALSGTLKGLVHHALVTAQGHTRTPDNAGAVLAAGEADRASARAVELDEGGDCHGCATAWKLAKGGVSVTLITPPWSARRSSAPRPRALRRFEDQSPGPGRCPCRMGTPSRQP
jgi:hypothetical protein